MTDPNKTSITIILDKSGSMSIARDDTIGGYNSFIETQSKLPGECELSLIQFNEESSFTHKSKDIHDPSLRLDTTTYIPSGNTAYLDAVGRAITEKGEELAKLSDDQRPGKVIFFIITDGQENASKTYVRSKIKEMILHQTNMYNWDFSFLGANIDAFDAADSIGISQNKSLSFSTTSVGGASRAFNAVVNYMCNAQSSDLKSNGYSAADRSSNSQ